jgi:Ser/Thr protein kinase RdoA (MazF antagonist)
MAKKSSFESLPREIRTALYRIDEPDTFEVTRNRYEAITVINKRISRVYKFVRKNKKLVTALDHEIDNLILLRNKKIAAPTPLNRAPLKGYDMVAYGYIDGDTVENHVLPEHTRLLAAAHKKLHEAFEREGKNKLADWTSSRVLKPIFAKSNADDFSPELVKFARSIAKSLKQYELAREDITLIHSDSHFSNVIYQGDRAVLIDWAESGWASKYFELGVTIHALTYEKKVQQAELIRSYLNEYFGGIELTDREIELIELHVKLRFLEGATWHLLESKEDQLLNRKRYLKFIEESFRKAQKFSISAATK